MFLCYILFENLSLDQKVKYNYFGTGNGTTIQLLRLCLWK